MKLQLRNITPHSQMTSSTCVTSKDTTLRAFSLIYWFTKLIMPFPKVKTAAVLMPTLMLRRTSASTLLRRCKRGLASCMCSRCIDAIRRLEWCQRIVANSAPGPAGRRHRTQPATDPPHNTYTPQIGRNKPDVTPVLTNGINNIFEWERSVHVRSLDLVIKLEASK